MTTITPLLSAAQVADLLQCSERTANEHASAGRLPAVKFGAGWVFPADALLEAINAMAKAQAQQRARPAKALAVQVKPARPDLVRVGV